MFRKFKGKLFLNNNKLSCLLCPLGIFLLSVKIVEIFI